MVVVHGGKEEENEGKTTCDSHVTRWPFVLTPLTDGRGKMVVFGCWMLYFGRVGSLWGLCTKVGSSWGEKVITPKSKTTTIWKSQMQFRIEN
jgi:hypothetical protein